MNDLKEEMNMFSKKLTAIVLITSIALSISSCGNSGGAKTSNERAETDLSGETTMIASETSAELQESTLNTSETLVTDISETEKKYVPFTLRDRSIEEENDDNFITLLTDLVYAYENPSETDEDKIAGDLEAIREVSETDYELALSISDNWREVFLDPDYTLYMYQGEDGAPELKDAGITNSAKHAIVILGYELYKGQMQAELVGRLDAAASLANAYPETLIVCSGGVTGPDNTEGNTEAGLMSEYLIEECGINPERVFIDERALTTADNAVNTFEILGQQGVDSVTIVTSSYHMRWGQAVYHTVAQLMYMDSGYQVISIANYCYDIAPSVYVYRAGDRFAAYQIGEIIGLSKEQVNTLPSFYDV